jgi:hypothetical protein
MNENPLGVVLFVAAVITVGVLFLVFPRRWK